MISHYCCVKHGLARCQRGAEGPVGARGDGQSVRVVLAAHPARRLRPSPSPHLSTLPPPVPRPLATGVCPGWPLLGILWASELRVLLWGWRSHVRHIRCPAGSFQARPVPRPLRCPSSPPGREGASRLGERVPPPTPSWGRAAIHHARGGPSTRRQSRESRDTAASGLGTPVSGPAGGRCPSVPLPVHRHALPQPSPGQPQVGFCGSTP